MPDKPTARETSDARIHQSDSVRIEHDGGAAAARFSAEISLRIAKATRQALESKDLGALDEAIKGLEWLLSEGPL